MHWERKSSIFRLLSGLPFGDSIHHLLQRHVTHEWPRRAPVLDELIVAAQDIVASVSPTLSLETSDFVEIGAGRDVAVALALRMMGVRSVTTLDIDRLARIDLVNHAAQYIGGKLGVRVPIFSTFDQLAEFGVVYRAPMTMLEANDLCFDCFYSVDTLEHIPQVPLAEVLNASREKLKPGGLCVHIIDYSDHFARGSDASRLNFLRYSETDWAKHNSRFLYMNRLRHSQFVALFEQAGFSDIEDFPFRIALDDINIDQLDPHFQAMSASDISTLRARIVARA